MACESRTHVHTGDIDLLLNAILQTLPMARTNPGPICITKQPNPRHICMDLQKQKAVSLLSDAVPVRGFQFVWRTHVTPLIPT